MVKLSKQAMEHKREYNKKYTKEYREKNNIISFTAPMPKSIADEITEFLKEKKITKKDFIIESYKKLKKDTN